MVSLVTSHFQALGDYFFHQSGLFKYFQNTTSGIDKFFIPRFKNKLYGNKNNQIEHGSIKASLETNLSPVKIRGIYFRYLSKCF